MAHNAETRLRFAEEFLRTGSVTESAKAVGIPRTTGSDIAKVLEADEEFVKTRRALLTNRLERAELMASGLMELAARRAKKKPRESATGEIQDKSPDYMRAFADLYRSAQAHVKLRTDANKLTEGGQAGPVEVRITVKGADPVAPTVSTETALESGA